jgi:branched-chain amino acid transport system ATP-binding protein
VVDEEDADVVAEREHEVQEVLGLVAGEPGAGLVEEDDLGRAGTGDDDLEASLHAARSGTVRVDGRTLPAGDPIASARAGIAIVPQGRRVFRSLTVAEHLTIASRGTRDRGGLSRDELFDVFPRLAERLGVRARALSGGEQQMLAIARAVCTAPSVLVLDEPTEGLAPAIVDAVGALVTRLAATGVAVLLTEQQGAFPHAVASRVLHLHRGVVEPVAAPGRQEVAR